MSGKKTPIGIMDFMMINLFRISPRSSTHPGRVKKTSRHMMRVGPPVEILDNKRVDLVRFWMSASRSQIFLHGTYLYTK